MLEHILAIHPNGAKKFVADEIKVENDPQANVQHKAQAGRVVMNGGIAVLPLMGGVRHRAGFFGVSVEGFREKFRAAISNPEIKAIIINVDSPGGTVSGVPELANEIFEARGKKPIIAVADVWAASAAYWIAAAADRIVVTPSGAVGSIGVFAMHVDQSKFLDDIGFKVSLVHAGVFKVEGNSFEPLTEAARAQIQKEVNGVYEQFITDVARFRGVDIDVVLNGFGQGRMVRAKDAVAENMADSVATFDEVINNLVSIRVSRRQNASTKLKLACCR